MKKYKVFINEVCYYKELEIEANDEDEAGEKYMKMVVNGDVGVVKSEYQEVNVTKE